MENGNGGGGGLVIIGILLVIIGVFIAFGSCTVNVDGEIRIVPGASIVCSDSI